MPGFRAALEKALADSVVFPSEWNTDLKVKWEEAIRNSETAEIQGGLGLLVQDKRRVVMPTVLADITSSAPADFQGLIDQISQIVGDQEFIKNHVASADSDRNGLNPAEITQAYTGLHYLQTRRGFDHTVITGGINLLVATWREERKWLEEGVLNLFAAQPNQTPAHLSGWGVNTDLVTSYRSAKVSKPKPVARQHSGKRDRGNSTGNLDALFGRK